MRYTIPSNAALLYATTPVLVLLFSWIFLGEKLTGMKVAGMAIAFIGVMVVIFERGFQASMDYLAGNLLLAVAVVAWGLYSVFGKRLIEKYGAIQATSMTLIIGTFMFLPIGIIPAINFPYETLTTGNWMEIGYLAAITSVFSYFLWYFAIGEIEAGKVALFTYLQPVLTSILTVLLLGQQITTAFLIGGVLALIGVIVAQFSRS
jgi:drug/metabolite transporter (DMT)-like permease